MIIVGIEMNLEAALVYAEKKQREGHKSDGCTLVPDFGIKKYCVMHDMLRRFAPVSAFEADSLYFKGICSEGKRYWLVAVFYWLGVRAEFYVGVPGILGGFFMSSFILFAYWRSGG